MNDANITGGRELDQLLQTLPAKLETNIMRGALRAGANVYLVEVRRNLAAISKTDGLLGASRVTTRKGKDGNVTASVKVGRGQVYYAHMVEFGTRPHAITAKAMTINGNVVRSVAHPGAKPKPFMRPAAEAKFAEAVAAVQARIRKRLTKEGLSAPEPTPAGEAEE